MVKGLDLFREHFRGYADRYVLIGGTACDLAMGEAGLDFRATRDLDIILMEKEEIDFKSLGLGATDRKSVLAGIRRIYSLD